MKLPDHLGDKAKLAYVAGFVDGEGCILLERRGYLRLEITNTGLPTLLFIQGIIGGSVAKKSHKVNKTVYRLRVSGAAAKDAITRLQPYLIEKQSQAVLAILYGNLPTELQKDTVIIESYRSALSKQKKEEQCPT